jgi:hypothetical protein
LLRLLFDVLAFDVAQRQGRERRAAHTSTRDVVALNVRERGPALVRDAPEHEPIQFEFACDPLETGGRLGIAIVRQAELFERDRALLQLVVAVLFDHGADLGGQFARERVVDVLGPELEHGQSIDRRLGLGRRDEQETAELTGQKPGARVRVVNFGDSARPITTPLDRE